MSVEQAKAFAEKALKDPAILKKLNTEGADIISIAKEHGHEFDEEHIEAGQAHLGSLTDEMSDEELNNVAGGAFTTMPVRGGRYRKSHGAKGDQGGTGPTGPGGPAGPAGAMF